MTWTVTVGGQTFSNTNLDGTAYADEANGFPALLAAFASEAGFLKGIGNTSTTSFTPSITTQTLTLDQTPALSVGLLVCAKSASDATHYIIGSIAAIDGNDIDIAATIAGGGTAKADWVVTYPISGNVFDGNGDFATPNGSLSAKDADASLTAGGQRAFISLEDVGGQKYAFVGGTAGGGSGVVVSLTNGGAGLINSDVGGNTKTIFGGNRITSGMEYSIGAFGSLGTSTYNIGWDTNVTAFGTLAGSPTLNVLTPDAGYLKPYLLILQQDATGGRVPTFQRHGNTTQMKWLTAEPDWAGQAAWFGTIVSIIYDRGNERLWLSTPTLEDIFS